MSEIFLIIVIIAAIIFILFFAVKSNAETQMTQPQPKNCCNITNDPSTWPTGDRIWLICHAIAYAEGANHSGSIPDRANNPGDISDDFNLYGDGIVGICSRITVFPSKLAGWQRLHLKWENILAGNSREYDPDSSWTVIAQTWASDWKAWVTNVTSKLGVDPNSTPAQYMM